mmetsp:Transcript_33286/g.105260  ORF Transcript_33286/g.105260 Transcript_33286/m.105260 type:complete len:204 (-) Transcript_33286:382-993(-)
MVYYYYSPVRSSTVLTVTSGLGCKFGSDDLRSLSLGRGAPCVFASSAGPERPQRPLPFSFNSRGSIHPSARTAAARTPRAPSHARASPPPPDANGRGPSWGRSPPAPGAPAAAYAGRTRRTRSRKDVALDRRRRRSAERRRRRLARVHLYSALDVGLPFFSPGQVNVPGPRRKPPIPRLNNTSLRFPRVEGGEVFLRPSSTLL